MMDAEGEAALVDAVEAVIGADAGPDVVFALLQDLAHDVRVGHVGARHADHVDLSGGNRMAGRRHILNPRGVEDREADLLTQLSGQIKEGRGLRRFLLRGLEKVDAEWHLIAATHNLLKLFRHRRSQQQMLATATG